MLEPVVLEGHLVRLEPLGLDHHAALCAVGLDPELWRWIPTTVRTPDDLRRYIAKALADQAAGVSLPFAIIERATGTAIGSTRYMSIVPEHRRLEIGATWLGRAWQRTGCNTECKRLLLGHAFEVLGYHRVELKTDVLNAQSRAAILRLGATQEGIFRRHVVCDTGRVRDTVYFSILDHEWPAVKARLSR